jgi:hypothetical protein
MICDGQSPAVSIAFVTDSITVGGILHTLKHRATTFDSQVTRTRSIYLLVHRGAAACEWPPLWQYAPLLVPVRPLLNAPFCFRLSRKCLLRVSVRASSTTGGLIVCICAVLWLHGAPSDRHARARVLATAQSRQRKPPSQRRAYRQLLLHWPRAHCLNGLLLLLFIVDVHRLRGLFC